MYPQKCIIVCFILLFLYRCEISADCMNCVCGLKIFKLAYITDKHMINNNYPKDIHAFLAIATLNGSPNWIMAQLGGGTDSG